MSTRRRELTDDQGAVLGPLLPPQGSGKGRPSKDHRLMTEEISQMVLADTDNQNAGRNYAPQSARLAHRSALSKVILAFVTDDTELFRSLLNDDTELFRRCQNGPDFRTKLTYLSFDTTCQPVFPMS